MTAATLDATTLSATPNPSLPRSARHWRDFTAVLDSAPLDIEGEAHLIEGARAAFMRMHGHVEALGR